MDDPWTVARQIRALAVEYPQAPSGCCNMYLTHPTLSLIQNKPSPIHLEQEFQTLLSFPLLDVLIYADYAD